MSRKGLVQQVVEGVASIDVGPRSWDGWKRAKLQGTWYCAKHVYLLVDSVFHPEKNHRFETMNLFKSWVAHAEWLLFAKHPGSDISTKLGRNQVDTCLRNLWIKPKLGPQSPNIHSILNLEPSYFAGNLLVLTHTAHTQPSWRRNPQAVYRGFFSYAPDCSRTWDLWQNLELGPVADHFKLDRIEKNSSHHSEIERYKPFGHVSWTSFWIFDFTLLGIETRCWRNSCWHLAGNFCQVICTWQSQHKKKRQRWAIFQIDFKLVKTCVVFCEIRDACLRHRTHHGEWGIWCWRKYLVLTNVQRLVSRIFGFRRFRSVVLPCLLPVEASYSQSTNVLMVRCSHETGKATV